MDTSLLTRGAPKSSGKGLGSRKRSDCPLNALGHREDGGSRGTTMSRGGGDASAYSTCGQVEKAKKVTSQRGKRSKASGTRSSSQGKGEGGSRGRGGEAAQ